MQKFILDLSIILLGVGSLLFVKNWVVHIINGKKVSTFIRDNPIVFRVSAFFVVVSCILQIILNLFRK